ncbi:MAG: copper amine oxidase N-terminal domain-containing protein, partial [Armatimonadota bacterium]
VVDGKFLACGDWNSWGYFLYSRGDVEQPLVWKLWLRRHETGNKDGIETKIEVVRDKDNKVVATSRVDTKQYPTDPWVRYEFDMMHPSTSVTGGGFMTAKDLLSQDGAYTLKMSVSGAPYGVWKFAVVGGKFAPAGRTDRATADPLNYVMGGPDAFWYVSQAATEARASEMAAPERTFAQKGFIPDCKAVVAGGATLVMIAPVVTFLEAQSEWNAAAKTLSITHGERTLRLTVGQATAQGNAGPVALGAAPQQREGDFYAPLKAVAQALGAEVEWEAKTRLLMVIDGDRAGLIHVP